MTDSPSAAPHRQPFDDFGDQHEESNQQRGEELADSRRRRQRDGHGKFHGHAPLEQVRNRFLEDWIAADGDTGQSQPVDSTGSRDPARPDQQKNQRHQYHSSPFDAASGGIVFHFLVTRRLVRRGRSGERGRVFDSRR